MRQRLYEALRSAIQPGTETARAILFLSGWSGHLLRPRRGNASPVEAPLQVRQPLAQVDHITAQLAHVLTEASFHRRHVFADAGLHCTHVIADLGLHIKDQTGKSYPDGEHRAKHCQQLG